MKRFFNKFVLFTLLAGMLIGISFSICNEANAAPKKKAKGGLTQEQLDTMNKDLNLLTRKMT